MKDIKVVKVYCAPHRGLAILAAMKGTSMKEEASSAIVRHLEIENRKLEKQRLARENKGES